MLKPTVFTGILLCLAVIFGGCASSSKKSKSYTAAEQEALAKTEFLPAPHDKSVNWMFRANILTDYSPQDIKLVAPNRLLLVLASGWARSPLLIDTKAGAILWLKSLLECDDSIVNNRYCQVETAFIAVFHDMLLVRIQGDGGTKLVALDMATGNKRWSTDLPKAGEIHLLTVPSAEALLVIQQLKQQATLTFLNFSTGAVIWRSEVGYANGTIEPPPPVNSGESFWHFYDGVSKQSALDGKVAWHRQDILAGKQAPPMQLDKGRLSVLDGKNRLHILDADSGKTLASAAQHDNVVYTNIFPLGDRVYLRGMRKEPSGQPLFFTAAVRSSDGKELWIDYDKDPSVSNLIDEDGKVYFSTPFTLIALDRQTGARRFAVKASEIGKSFPVTIKKYGDKIVYIGELVIAAYNAKTGKEIYWHGFDPINQTAHMDALNDAIEHTQEYLSHFSGPLSGIDLKEANMSNFFFQQSVHSQNQSNYAAQQAAQYARTYEMTGDQLAASRSSIKMNESLIASSFGNAQFSMGMAFMTMENIQSSIAAASALDQVRLEKLLRMRKVLYQSYVGTQRGDYVYRTTKESGMVGISVIHLPSGRMQHTPLTPEYKEVGIYSLVDFENAVVYYGGVLQTEKKEGYFAFEKGYFISRPVKLPSPK